MFPERIRLLRKSQDLSQVELAGRLGVSKQSVSNWENGNILPSIDMLVKISTVFNVSTDYILGLDNRSSGARCYLEVTGLSVEKIAHLQQIINDMRWQNEAKEKDP